MATIEQTNFFYSNLFIAIITFVVGIFGLYLYYRQRSDQKKRAARIILLEIKNAESQLKDARGRLDGDKKSLPEHLYTMPTDSWSINKHLFVNDFQANQWASINEFYDKCQLFDEAIKHNDARFSEEEKEIRKSVHKATYRYVKEFGDKIAKASNEVEVQQIKNEFTKKRDPIASFLTTGENIFIYTPSKQLQDVEKYLQTINMNLSLTVVGTKLEKMSKNKLWIF